MVFDADENPLQWINDSVSSGLHLTDCEHPEHLLVTRVRSAHGIRPVLCGHHGHRHPVCDRPDTLTVPVSDGNTATGAGD